MNLAYVRTVYAAIVQVFLCTRSLAGNLGPHLHLILPPILSVLDDVNIDNNVRREALCKLFELIALKETMARFVRRRTGKKLERIVLDIM